MSNDQKDPSNPFGFFEKSSEPYEPKRNTPEEEARSLTEEKANFLSNQKDRLEELGIPVSTQKKVLPVLGERYQKWETDRSEMIKALPNSDMRYGDRDSLFRIVNLAEGLHQDVDKIVNAAKDRKTPLKDLVDRIKQRQQPSQGLNQDRER